MIFFSKKYWTDSNVEKWLWQLEFDQFQDYVLSTVVSYVNSLKPKLSFRYVLFINEFELILNPESQNFTTQKPPSRQNENNKQKFYKKRKHTTTTS